MKNTCSRMMSILAVALLLLSALPAISTQSVSAGTEKVTETNEEFKESFTLVYHSSEGTNDAFTGGRNGDTPMALYKVMAMAQDGDIYYFPAGEFTHSSVVTISKTVKLIGAMNDDGTPATKIKKGYFGDSSNGHLFNCAFRDSEKAVDKKHMVIKNFLIDNDTDNIITRANCGIQAIENVSVDVYNTKIINFNYFAALSVNSANALNDGNYYPVDTEMHCYGVKTEDNMATCSLFALPRHNQGTLLTDVISHAYLTYDNEDTSEFKDVTNFVMENPLTKRCVGYGNCIVNGYSLEELSYGELKVKLKGGIYAKEKTAEELSDGYICFKTVTDDKVAYIVAKESDTSKIIYDLDGGSGELTESIWMKGSEVQVDMKTPITKAGHIFIGWSKTKGATTPEYDTLNSWFTIGDENVTLYAVYTVKELNKCTVQVIVGDGGVANMGTTQVTSGGSLEFKFGAFDNYKVKEVYVDDVPKGAVNYYMLKDIRNDCTVRVEFESSIGTTTEYKDRTITETTTVNTDKYGTKTTEKITYDGGKVETVETLKDQETDVQTTKYVDSEGKVTVASVITSSATESTETTDEASVSDVEIQKALAQKEFMGGTGTDEGIVINTGESTSKETKRTDVGMDLTDETKVILSGNDVTVVSATGVVSMDKESVKGVIDTKTDATKLIITVGEPLSLTPEQQEKIGESTVVSAKVLIQTGTGEPVPYEQEFKGEVQVALNYKVKDPKNFRVYFVSQSGEIEEIMEKSYDEENEIVTFTVKHFSEYMIKDTGLDDKFTGVADVLVAIIGIAIGIITVVSINDYVNWRRRSKD